MLQTHSTGQLHCLPFCLSPARELSRASDPWASYKCSQYPEASPIMVGGYTGKATLSSTYSSRGLAGCDHFSRSHPGSPDTCNPSTCWLETAVPEGQASQGLLHTELRHWLRHTTELPEAQPPNVGPLGPNVSCGSCRQGAHRGHCGSHSPLPLPGSAQSQGLHCCAPVCECRWCVFRVSTHPCLHSCGPQEL